MNESTTAEKTGTATYCPEDNKLRLYVGRVPREEYLKLRAEGWTSTPKQNCDFVATWTPSRRDTCLDYAGIIEDEDMDPAERAADRAERFSGYRDKRTLEAVGHADRFDAGPIAHGYQSQARAERAAAKHDRIAARACDAWSKAEYWTARTDGVIRHALYKSTPAVRMGRIKELEAALRKHQADIEQATNRFKCWQDVANQVDPEKQTKMATLLAGAVRCWSEYPHPVHGRKQSLYYMLTDEQNPITGAQAAAFFLSDHREIIQDDDWSQHYKLRLAYENQMIESQGGRAAFVEMQVGGWIGSYQIRKVNKSNATGRVVSVQVLVKGGTQRHGKDSLETLNVERLAVDTYTPPTQEDIDALKATLAEEKAAAPKVATIPLINPTEEEAERLQALWNERAKAKFLAEGYYKPEDFKPSTVCRITQEVYSANSKGSYAKAETRGLCRNGQLEPRSSNMWSSEAERRAKERGPAVCKIRMTWGNGNTSNSAYRVIVITDKLQKAFPSAVWKEYTPAPNTQEVEEVNA